MRWLHSLVIPWLVAMLFYGIAIMIRPQLHGSRLWFIRVMGGVLVLVNLFLLADRLGLI